MDAIDTERLDASFERVNNLNYTWKLSETDFVFFDPLDRARFYKLTTIRNNIPRLVDAQLDQRFSTEQYLEIASSSDVVDKILFMLDLFV